MTDNKTTEDYAHTFVYDDIYNGRCIFCDCRPYGVHASRPCTGH